MAANHAGSPAGADSDFTGTSIPAPLRALLHLSSWGLELGRAVFPAKVSETPLLLTEGSLQDARPHTSHLHLEQIQNAEDLVIWPENEIAILSADPGRGIYNAFTGQGDEKAAGNGKLSTVDLRDLAAVTRILTVEGWDTARSFHPLGVNVTQFTETRAVLAVANCMPERCSVEIIQLDYTQQDSLIKATFLYSMEHDSITAPNAVVVLSERQVLFTNSFGVSPRKSHLFNSLEQILALPGGSVNLLTYDSSSRKTAFTPLISGIACANGLAMNRQQTILAVASSTAHHIKLYDIRDSAQGIHSKDQFVLRQRIHLNGMLPDNLRFYYARPGSAGQPGNVAEGEQLETLLCAGHPSALDFLKVPRNPQAEYRSPSRVVKVTFPSKRPAITVPDYIKDLFTSKGKEVQTVFECQGSFYGTSSTGAGFIGQDGMPELLVCGLFESGMLRCRNVDLPTE